MAQARSGRCRGLPTRDKRSYPSVARCLFVRFAFGRLLFSRRISIRSGLARIRLAGPRLCLAPRQVAAQGGGQAIFFLVGVHSLFLALAGCARKAYGRRRCSACASSSPVAGSAPLHRIHASSRSAPACCRSSGVEHSLGKGEVVSSNLTGSTSFQLDLDPAGLVFIDATGLPAKMARLRGRAPRGQWCRADVPNGQEPSLQS